MAKNLDFLNRISTFVLHFPPLRDLDDDVPWIWAQVYANAAERAGVPPRIAALGKQHHGRIVKILQQHQLPGNLRTLYLVAYHFLAARSDTEVKLSLDECVDEALAVKSPAPAAERPEIIAAAVARCFADIMSRNRSSTTRKSIVPPASTKDLGMM